jgi:antitoxin component of RelBE/YafQ-DinJ toxin-antitoxin module
MNVSDNIRVVLTYAVLAEDMPMHGMYCKDNVSKKILKTMEEIKRMMLAYGKKVRIIKRDDDLNRYWNCGTDYLYDVVDFEFEEALGLPSNRSVILCEHQIKCIVEE